MDHRSNEEPLANRRNSSQAKPPAAAQEVQHERFGIVVGMMAQGDFIVAVAGSRFPEKSVTRAAGRFFEGQPKTALNSAHIRLLTVKGKPVETGKIANEIRVPARVFPQPVIQVGNSQTQPVLRCPCHEQVQECHRIRPAGDSDEHGIASSQQPVPGNRQVGQPVEAAGTNSLNEGHQGSLRLGLSDHAAVAGCRVLGMRGSASRQIPNPSTSALTL